MIIFYKEKWSQDGYCNTCGVETGNKYYVFCSKLCNNRWYWVKENHVNKHIPFEVFKQWLEEKTIAVEKMTPEEIQARIDQLGEIEFYSREEGRLLYTEYGKKTGKNGISPWLKSQRDGFITEPEFKVDWEGEPRKKEKKPKQDYAKEFLGIDLNAGIAALKNKSKPKESKVDGDALADLMKAMAEPTKPEPVMSEEEQNQKINSFLDALKGNTNE